MSGRFLQWFQSTNINQNSIFEWIYHSPDKKPERCIANTKVKAKATCVYCIIVTGPRKTRRNRDYPGYKCREDFLEKRIIQSIPIISLNKKDIYEGLLKTKSLNRELVNFDSFIPSPFRSCCHCSMPSTRSFAPLWIPSSAPFTFPFMTTHQLNYGLIRPNLLSFFTKQKAGLYVGAKKTPS